MLLNARRSLPSLYDFKLPDEGKLNFCDNLEEAVKNVEWIQESVPERLEIKQEVYKDIQKYCKNNTILASSTTGFKPSKFLLDRPNNPTVTSLGVFESNSFGFT